MRRVSNGFTIIEVMIFFTVSSLLIASAWGLIAGRQEQVMFDQKVRETQSKLQQWMSDVSNGVTNGDPDTQWCDIRTGVPKIVDQPNKSSLPSYSPQCTFLGKAIQFTDNNTPQGGTLYAYSVFGCLIDSCGASGKTNLPTDMLSAIPEPAVGGSAIISSKTYTYANLTEAFDLSPAYVKSVCGIPQTGGSCPNPSSSRMIGFMNTFNNDQNLAGNGSEDLNIFLYGLNKNTFPPAASGNTVTNCLEGNDIVAGTNCQLGGGQPNNPLSLQSYQFCLTDGKYYVEITISSASGVGATTKLDYITC